MSAIRKLAKIGLVALGTAVALGVMSSFATANVVRGTCSGQMAIADSFRADATHSGNVLVNPGDRISTRLDLNRPGWVRWYCVNGAGVTAHRAHCLDGVDRAVAEARFWQGGGLHSECN